MTVLIHVTTWVICRCTIPMEEKQHYKVFTVYDFIYLTFLQGKTIKTDQWLLGKGD